MERAAVDRVDLDAVDEDRAGLAAVDRQVDQGVLAGLAAEQLELVGVERHVLGADAVAVHDGRQATGAAEAGDLLAGRRRAARRRGSDGASWRWTSGRDLGLEFDLGGRGSPTRAVGAPGTGAHLITERRSRGRATRSAGRPSRPGVQSAAP